MIQNVSECIRTRRSTRLFAKKELPRELVEQVVEAGRYAPSGGNNQSTHFLVIRDREVLDHLAKMAEEAFAAMEETPEMYKSLRNSVRASKKGGYVFHYNAPVLIVTANQKNYGNNIADCACALENMMIMANDLDLGSCWINQLRWLNEEPALVKALQELGMMEEERVYGALALGYAATEDGQPNRNPLPRTGNPVDWIG